MSTTLYILGILSALVTLGIVIEMLRRRHLKERHAVWWLVGGTGALVIAVFPGLLEAAAGLVGVQVPVNLAFFASLAILFFVCIQHSSELTVLEEKLRILTEEAALLDLRVRSLERGQGADGRGVEGHAAGAGTGAGSPDGVESTRRPEHPDE